ncbi:integrase-like protein, partial [Ruminiclostridium sufflavum DSM 19573]
NTNFKKWNGFNIYSVDGSTVQVPNSEENLKIFGTNPNQYNKNGALASVSVLYDVMNDIIVDAEFSRYRSNERESAKNHIKKLSTKKNSIILFDRGYPSKDLFEYINSNNLLFLMRLSRSFKSLIFEESDKVIEYQQRNSKESILFHSDRGSQYSSNAYQDLLSEHKIVPSMSRKGNPYDNAVAENFFSNMKCECTNFYRFKTRQEAK